MRLLFVADGRSPTSRSWIAHWLASGDEVHLVTTYPCEPIPGVASATVIPVAGSGMTGPARARSAGFGGALRRSLRPLRYFLGPVSLPIQQRKLAACVRRIQPDVVHAMRIPFEGMLASLTPAGIPLIVSIWGNDLTLHAGRSPWLAALTRRTLRRADGLLADAGRDIRLAEQWDFKPDRPSLVVPGAGGIRMDAMHELPESDRIAALPAGPLVVNPRGQRPGSLLQDVFFQSIPLVLAQNPQVGIICPPLQDDPQARQWVDSLGIAHAVQLWPQLPQRELWALYRRAAVYVSPSVHDGTPNSMLEAMACGCFPVVGDIASMREWIRDGENGYLVDARSPQALAEAILRALNSPDLRDAAKKENARLIADRAEYGRCMAKAEAFYRSVIGNREGPVPAPG
jgi:glycosyltransferase involved in cell wall biosynthesis